jgi:hypothetical protein
MTPEEGAAWALPPKNGQKDASEKVEEFLVSADPRDILGFAYFVLRADPNNRHLEAARSALSIRISEGQAEAAESFRKQVVELIDIAAEQKRLAAKLDGQTDTLIGLTRRLRHLTFWLLVLTLALCAFEGYHLLEGANSRVVPAPAPPASVPSALVQSAKEASLSAARVGSLLEPTRFEIVQSPLTAKWTFRLDRFAGRVCQLVETPDSDVAWEEMSVRDLPSIDLTQKHVRFQIFTSPLAARHTYLIDLDTGNAWRITTMLDENHKETGIVWEPFAAH